MGGGEFLESFYIPEARHCRLSFHRGQEAPVPLQACRQALYQIGF